MPALLSLLAQFIDFLLRRPALRPADHRICRLLLPALPASCRLPPALPSRIAMARAASSDCAGLSRPWRRSWAWPASVTSFDRDRPCRAQPGHGGLAVGFTSLAKLGFGFGRRLGGASCLSRRACICISLGAASCSDLDLASALALARTGSGMASATAAGTAMAGAAFQRQAPALPNSGSLTNSSELSVSAARLPPLPAWHRPQPSLVTSLASFDGIWIANIVHAAGVGSRIEDHRQAHDHHRQHQCHSADQATGGVRVSFPGEHRIDGLALPYAASRTADGQIPSADGWRGCSQRPTTPPAERLIRNSCA